MKKTNLLKVVFGISLLCTLGVLSANAQNPTIVINGDSVSASNTSNPAWLKTGTTLAKGAKVTAISVIQFNLDSVSAANYELQFDKALLISVQQAVPANKVWKVESVLLDKTVSTTGSGGGDNLGNHTASQSLDMSAEKIINVPAPVDSTDAVNAVTVQRGSLIYAADAGSTDDYAIAISPAIGAYTSGMVIHFKANTANTGAATLNVNSLGAKTIKKNFNTDLADNDIKAGQQVSVIYDGTNFQMLSQLGNAASGGTSFAIFSPANTYFCNTGTITWGQMYPTAVAAGYQLANCMSQIPTKNGNDVGWIAYYYCSTGFSCPCSNTYNGPFSPALGSTWSTNVVSGSNYHWNTTPCVNSSIMCFK